MCECICICVCVGESFLQLNPKCCRKLTPIKGANQNCRSLPPPLALLLPLPLLLAPPKMTHNKFLFVALLNLTFSQTADYPWDTHGAGITIIPCMIRVWSVCHLSAWHWPYNTLASSLPQPLLDCAWYLHRHSLWAGMIGAWCCAVWAWHPSMALVWRVPRKKANSSIT